MHTLARYKHEAHGSWIWQFYGKKNCVWESVTARKNKCFIYFTNRREEKNEVPKKEEEQCKQKTHIEIEINGLLHCFVVDVMGRSCFEWITWQMNVFVRRNELLGIYLDLLALYRAHRQAISSFRIASTCNCIHGIAMYWLISSFQYQHTAIYQ